MERAIGCAAVASPSTRGVERRVSYSLQNPTLLAVSFWKKCVSLVVTFVALSQLLDEHFLLGRGLLLTGSSTGWHGDWSRRFRHRVQVVDFLFGSATVVAGASTIAAVILSAATFVLALALALGTR